MCSKGYLKFYMSNPHSMCTFFQRYVDKMRVCNLTVVYLEIYLLFLSTANYYILLDHKGP